MNKKIKNAIVNLCLRESAFEESVYEETHDILADVDWSTLNIDSLDFESVYRFITHGEYFLAHNFENEEMFRGKRAVKLYENVEAFTSEAYCCGELFEIWLTSGMEIEFVGCFIIDITGTDGDYTIEYRYPISGNFPGEFDVECFFDILSNWYGISENDLAEKNDAL